MSGPMEVSWHGGGWRGLGQPGGPVGLGPIRVPGTVGRAGGGPGVLAGTVGSLGSKGPCAQLALGLLAT